MPKRRPQPSARASRADAGRAASRPTSRPPRRPRRAARAAKLSELVERDPVAELMQREDQHDGHQRVRARGDQSELAPARTRPIDARLEQAAQQEHAIEQARAGRRGGDSGVRRRRARAEERQHESDFQRHSERQSLHPDPHRRARILPRKVARREHLDEDEPDAGPARTRASARGRHATRRARRTGRRGTTSLSNGPASTARPIAAGHAIRARAAAPSRASRRSARATTSRAARKAAAGSPCRARRRTRRAGIR